MDGYLEINNNTNVLEIVNTENPEINLVSANVPITIITKESELVVTEISDRGLPGLSAYEVAVLNGFVGTEEQWLASLQGPPGLDGSGAYFSEILIITSAIENSFDLAYAPNSNSLSVFLNGLRERSSSFSISGNTIDFSVLDIAEGDEITFEYRVGD